MFDDITTSVLSKAVQGYGARNTAIANNIANADTPGYKRVDVDFEQSLADAIMADHRRLRSDVGSSISSIDGTTTDSAISQVSAGVDRTNVTTMRIDGSNVDPDDEMARLSSNQLASNTVVSLLDKRFAQFLTAITGR